MKLYSHACGGFDRTIVVGDMHGCHDEMSPNELPDTTRCLGKLGSLGHKEFQAPKFQ
jgi:hypothetical protein